MGLNQWIYYYDEENNPQEIIYRKVNWLRRGVIDHTSMTHEDDTEPIEIERNQLEELLDDIKHVQKFPDDAEEVLLIQRGFFFGTYDYSQWYWDTLEEVKKDIEYLLSIKNLKEVTYEDWW